MRIVQIEDFFHPDAGYQVNILSKEWARNGHDVYIITAKEKHLPDNLTKFFDFRDIESKDSAYEIKYNVKIIRVDTNGRISSRIIFRRRIFKLIDSLEPSILYVHGNDTYIGIITALRINKLKYPVIFDTHMVDMASNNKFNKLFYFFYKKIITPKLVRNKVYILRTAEVDYIFDKFNYPFDLSPNLGFGSDVSIFFPSDLVKRRLKKEMNIPDDSFVFIYAGKLDETKGGYFLSESLLKKVESTKKLTFIIIGNCNSNRCEDIEFNFTNSENNVIRFPTQAYENLGDLFRVADVAIFPKQCSLSFYDMQASGLPVILENNEVNMTRAGNQNGILFNVNDKESFRKALVDYANMNSELFDEHVANSLKLIKEHYDYSKIAIKYLSYLELSIKNFKEVRSK